MANKEMVARIKARNTRVARTNCGAGLKNGGTCKKRAGEGTTHPGWGRCLNHKGMEPAYQKAAVLAEAKYLGQTYTTPVPTDPSMALVEEMARTHGAIVFLDLAMEAELLNLPKDVDPLDHIISARFSLLRKLRDSERDRLTRISTVCINLGLKARELRLAEQMGSLIQSVLEATLNDLHLTPEQRDAAKQILAGHLQHAARTVVEAELVP